MSPIGSAPKRWHHAPPHHAYQSGVTMVTAGTLRRRPRFNTPERLDIVRDRLLESTRAGGWQLHAWVVLANHYHFIGEPSEGSKLLPNVVGRLHMETARAINRLDASPGRKVWFQFWDTPITNESSYLARLNYVHQNPVRHGMAVVATAYRWCSAAEFAAEADLAFVRRVAAMPIDEIQVDDDYD